MEPKTTGKRIVSKGEYVCKLAGKTLLPLPVLIGCLILVKILINLVRLFVSRPDGIPFFPTVLVLSLPIITLIGGLWCAFRVIQVTKQLNTGVPLTRTNTANLPAPESLVRAGEEPQQAQEGVLLRAAAQQQTPPEQLVRATTGRENR